MMPRYGLLAAVRDTCAAYLPLRVCLRVIRSSSSSPSGALCFTRKLSAHSRLKSRWKRQFSATVLNATNTSVTWTASGGTINQTGLYTAGSTPGSFIVRATSTEDPAKSATANIEIAANFGRVTLHWVDGQGNSEDMVVITTSPIRPSGVSFPQYEGSAIVESYRLHLENVANGQCSGNFGPETTTVTSPTSAIIWVTTPGNGIYEMLIRFFVATRVECTGQTEVVHTAAVCRIGLAVRDASGQITGLDFGAPLSPDMADPNCTASGVVRFEPG